jgi:iron complex outermembrane receptor protein
MRTGWFSEATLCAVLFLVLIPQCSRAGEPQAPPHGLGDLTEISLEELANVEVTSVAKKPQKLSQVAAAVYVITQEDIHRSGLTRIPELLRMCQAWT